MIDRDAARSRVQFRRAVRAALGLERPRTDLADPQGNLKTPIEGTTVDDELRITDYVDDTDATITTDTPTNDLADQPGNDPGPAHATATLPPHGTVVLRDSTPAQWGIAAKKDDQ